MTRRLIVLSAAALIGLATWLCWPDRPGEAVNLRPVATAALPVESGAPAAEPSQPAAPPAVDAPAIPVAKATEKRAPNFSKIIAFQEWTTRWAAADPAQRMALKEEGARLAKDRRSEFKALIVADPQNALEYAVSRVIRQDLPGEIVSELEKPVSDTGAYKVYLGRPLPGAEVSGDELALRYFETAEGESYKARVFGSMLPVMSKESVALRGVAVDREFAVAESPVRQLETGERIPAGATVEENCPVSGKTTTAIAQEQPVTEDTPTVEVGKRLITLCNGAHVSILDEEYRGELTRIEASGPGGAGFFYDTHPGTSSEAIGNFRCLYIRITYPDQLKAPNTEDSAYSDMRNVSRYYLESSYGKLTTTTIVTPLVTLPHTQAWYIAKDDEVDGLGLVHSDARSAARRLGYDSNQFNCTIVRVNGGPRLSGISWGGGDSVWVSWDGMDVLNHECGHSLGRNHANYWNTTDGTAYGDGSNQEYGNSFDVMGGGGGFGAHYNTISKRALGWLPDIYVHRPTTNGVFRLFAYDQPQLEDGKRYAFRIAKDSARTYYIEYHPAMGGQLPDSAVVLYSISGQSNAGHLLDTTPGSSGGKGDGGIQIGRTYSDPEADMHFTVVGKNATTPPSLDLAYFKGPFPGNSPPTLNLQASATSISAGGSVTFTSSATDPDGDTLAYQWDFNDGVASTNTPNFTRVFPSADQMTVLLTVSDMKGGVARGHVVVNVGSHGRQQVTGQITWNGQPLQGVRVSNAGGKYCFTNAAGNYALTDLTTGSHTLSAALNGFTFTAGFTNPINVVAGTNTANWTATSSTLVTLTKTADAVEGEAGGMFVLTRTGSTSVALTVRVAPVSGTAAKTTDYTFSPDYATDGSFRTFTIPAGQASLSVAVAAVNDTAQEGPETILLQLAANTGYLTLSQGAALMTLSDNDTTLPQVSVYATDPYAVEFPAAPGVFTFSRTGPTTAALAISVGWSGPATNGSDYTTQPNTITIPAGQASIAVNLNPLNDAAIETPEDCTVTINSNAAYVRDTSAQTATVNIADDDAPEVSLTVLDANAAEAGRDPGVFLITRTGSTASPLTVYYGVSGSALHGTDYAALDGRVIIPAGAESVPVIITPYDDDLGEPDTQSVTLNIATYDSAYSLGTSFAGNISIADNDDVPVVWIRNGATANEPGTSGSFIIRATGSATGNITVNYTVSGTATPGTDYTALSGSVSISANGSNEVTINVPVRDDAIAEDTETIIATLTPSLAYRIYNDGTAITRLRDDETDDRVMVSTWNSSPAEGGAAGQFYFSRSGTAGALVVAYTVSGTATNGVDFTTLSGSVTIPDGESGVDVTVSPLNDSLNEGSESVTVTVVAGADYGAEVPNSATLFIADDESHPISIGFQSANGTTTEAPGATGEFRDIAVTLSTTSTDTITVQYTGGGGTAYGDDIDWAFADAANGNAIIPNGALTFPPGVVSKNVRILVKNDGVSEGSETAILELRNPQFSRLSTTRNKHTLTISDANDPVRRVRFIVASTTRTEADVREPMLMAVLDRPSAGATSVNFTVSGTATSGSDYTLPVSTLNFASGESAKLLPLTILADGVAESPETIVVTLTNPTNAEIGTPAAHTITLTESTLPVVEITPVTAEVAESAGPAKFQVNRTGGPAGLAVTVFYTLSGSAVVGSDYTAPSGSVTLPANVNSALINVALVNDTTEEQDESLVATLTENAAYDIGAADDATLTIADDDAPPTVAITLPKRSAVTIPPGVGIMLQAEGTQTTPQGSTSVPVTWSKLSGPGDVTFEAWDSNTTAATFSAVGAYTLRATATLGGAPGTSDLAVHVGGTLTAQTVGTTTAAGFWSEADTTPGTGDGGVLTVTGAGTGISGSGTSDGFYFLAAPVTGDFDVRCRVLSINNPGAGGSCRVGIMVRQSTASTAPYAMTLHKADGVHGYQARLTASTNPYDVDGTTEYTFPNWIRLVRVGNTFAGYYSTNGAAWTQRGTTQIIDVMGASPLLGLAVTSAISGTPSTAAFDSLNFYLPVNTGPFVNAGPSLSGFGPWSLDGTITDDGRPSPSSISPLWQLVTGAGSANFTSPSAADTTVNFAASGSYRLRLTAADGSITTFDETTATVTSMAALQAWRQSHFGDPGNSGNGSDLADPDHDGIFNLIEYTLDTSPTQPGPVPMSVSFEGGLYEIAFNRNPAHNDAIVTLEGSSDLSSWTALARSEGGGPFASLQPAASVQENGASPVAVTITINDGQPGPTQKFFRLRAETVTP